MNRTYSRLSKRLPAARGFTLVELMVVLAIASILLSAAIPSFTSMIRSVRLTSAANDLFASILLTRSESAKRHARVAMCKSADASNCTAIGGWEQGWIVFHDVNNNGLREGGEQVISSVEAMPRAMRLSGNFNVAKYISYAPTGESKLASGAFQAGTITLCNASAGKTEGREIVINAGGRPRVQKSRLASCA